MMVLGYAIIAVPVGLLGAEVSARENERERSASTASAWSAAAKAGRPGGASLHDDDAKFCKLCGSQLLLERA